MNVSEISLNGKPAVRVTLNWLKQEHECTDCGLPAAFASKDAYGPGSHDEPLCAICAANHAADGETIIRIVDLDTSDPLCRHCGRLITPTEFGTWQDADNPGYEVCELSDDDGPSHEPAIVCALPGKLTANELHVLLDVLEGHTSPWSEYETDPNEDPKVTPRGWEKLRASARAKLEAALNVA